MRQIPNRHFLKEYIETLMTTLLRLRLLLLLRMSLRRLGRIVGIYLASLRQVLQRQVLQLLNHLVCQPHSLRDSPLLNHRDNPRVFLVHNPPHSPLRSLL